MNTFSIGLVIPSKTQLFSTYYFAYYFSEILRGCISCASIFNCDILLIPPVSPDKEMNYLKIFRTKKISGMIILAPLSNDKGLIELEKQNIPVVLINGKYKNLSFIDANNLEGAKKAVEYLINLGHKRIAIINGLLNGANGKDRFNGYKLALSTAKIKIDKNLMGFGEFDQDKSYHEMLKLLNYKFTAVFCANDVMALGAIKAIEEKKLKIPDDISVVGFDNLVTVSHISPPLTTVQQPIFELGKESVSLLVEIINKNITLPKKLILNTNLIVRKSCTKLHP